MTDEHRADPDDPWLAVLGGTIDAQPQMAGFRAHVAVPGDGESWWRLAEFALTFDGYKHFGGFERLSAMAHGTATAWRTTGALPEALEEARGALFFEQRRHRHADYTPRGRSRVRAGAGAADSGTLGRDGGG